MKLTKRQRVKLCKELIEQTSQPDWYDTDPPEVLATKRFAVTIERDEESWIDGVDTWEEIAQIELGVTTGPEYDVEWVESVIDLQTGEPVLYTRTTIVVLHYDNPANGHRETYSAAS